MASITSRRSNERLLTTNESGLLISWATPAARRPRLASFSVWIKAALALAHVVLEANDPLSGTQPDPKLVAVERLGQEVVGAGFHPLDQVLLLGFRRHEHGVNIAGPLGRADGAGAAPARPAPASSSR